MAARDDGGRWVILVVDDDRELRDLLSDTLNDNAVELGGVDVLVAADGAEAATLARHVSFDLVLLDLMMPEMDGFDLCRWLRANAGAASVPVIAISAMSPLHEATRRAAEVGCDDFLSKPFDVDDLLAAVQRWLGQRRDARPPV